MALPFALKKYLATKKNYGISNISPCENIIVKKSSKTNQNPSTYHNFITNLKFQHKSKILSSFKLSYYILYNESKHNILAFLVVGKANNKHTKKQFQLNSLSQKNIPHKTQMPIAAGDSLESVIPLNPSKSGFPFNKHS
jgi:hypothetical protein